MVGKLPNCNSCCANAFSSPSALNFPTFMPLPPNFSANSTYDASIACDRVKNNINIQVGQRAKILVVIQLYNIKGLVPDKIGTKVHKEQLSMDLFCLPF
ncbi:hypothetical protein Hanom_Chr16g01478331 [Helianthus anomalus]